MAKNRGILVDTHCHIHDAKYKWPKGVVEGAKKAGVTRMITAGTDIANSRAAIEFAGAHDGVYATVGIHPGIKTKEDVAELEKIIVENIGNNKLVGLGDIGLDYHYKPFDRGRQIKLFKAQLKLAVKYDLPVSFHIREAFDDFWPIFDSFKGLRGALHCYTDNLDNLKKALDRGLFISVNGIATFNKDPELEKAFKQIPLNKILLETDAPYLTPIEFRDKLNVPAYVESVVRCWAGRCGCEITEIADITTNNATTLFSLR